MSTTREKLEAKAAELRAFRRAYDAKCAEQKNTPDDDQVLLRMSNEMVELTEELSQVDPPHQLYNEKTGKFTSLMSLGDAAPDGYMPDQKQARDIKAADLTFTKAQMEDLHYAAVNRRVGMKAALSVTEVPQGGQSQRLGGVFPYLREAHRILDLIPQERTDRTQVDYFRALAPASAAAAVAPGANKPESSPTWEEASAPVRKLAHYTSAHDEVVADFPSFLNVVGTEMLAGLIAEENEQLLVGNGTAPNLRGLTTTTGVLTVGSAGTDLDAIVAAWAALRTGAAHCDPDVVVMHPNDWLSTGFLLAKDSTNRYLVGDPVSNTKPMLWGVPVVVTEAMTENTAMVANLGIAATAYIRQAPTLEVAPGAGDAAFINNTTLLRAEERLALAVHHPAAICLVTAV